MGGQNDTSDASAARGARRGGDRLGRVACAEPVFENGKLLPLADGFPDRPITLVNVDDPGTRDGIYARSLQEALRDISPVEVLVSDEPAPSFGTFYAVQDIQDREGGNDGYYPIILTIPGSSADILVEPITEETGLTLDDLNLVVGTERIPYVLIQKKDAPWGKTWRRWSSTSRPTREGEIHLPPGRHRQRPRHVVDHRPARPRGEQGPRALRSAGRRHRRGGRRRLLAGAGRHRAERLAVGQGGRGARHRRLGAGAVGHRPERRLGDGGGAAAGAVRPVPGLRRAEGCAGPARRVARIR